MRVVKPVYFTAFPHQVECNICQWEDNKLQSDAWHPYVICLGCGSKIRQRLFWAAVTHIEEFSEVFSNKRVLHFAPDKCLTKRISKEAKQYITADFLAEGYSYKHIDLNLDISNMKAVDDEAFDCVIAFDVLEHVPNYLQALEEVHRVLSPGGYCIFTVPQQDDLETTFEDPTITDPKGRERTYGQWDHLRIYGNDFKDKIASRGFDVTMVSKDDFDSDLVRKSVLYPPILSDNPLATNNRLVYFGKKTASIADSN